MDKLVPLADVPDEQDFWRGTRIRLFGVGLNVTDKAQDYYDYMLVEVPGEREWMLCTNVTRDAGKNKAGASMCAVKTLDGVNRFVVTGKSLKFSVGTEKTLSLIHI